jgi:hypothetical protein
MAKYEKFEVQGIQNNILKIGSKENVNFLMVNFIISKELSFCEALKIILLSDSTEQLNVLLCRDV